MKEGLSLVIKLSSFGQRYSLVSVIIRAVAIVATSGMVLSAPAAAGPLEQYRGLSCGQMREPAPSGYKRVVKDLSSNKTLDIEGPEWNDTLVLNCHIKNVKGDGIRIRNVRNLTIQGCEIENVSGAGIAMRSSGGSENVSIIGNRIEDTGSDGISAAKREARGVDHTGLLIGWNVVRNTGERGRDGYHHGIYTQVSDAVVIANTVKADRDGNAISVRSSGLVACNEIAGRSRSGKPGIRYFADHSTGPSGKLLIRNNFITGTDVAVELIRPSDAYARRPKSIVRVFDIRGNRSTAQNVVAVDDYWSDRRIFEISLNDNKRVSN